MSSSSSARAAQQALAARLREIRLDADISKREIARRAGWHESKSSRLEGGVTAPRVSDIEAWCTACGAVDQIPDLVAALHAADALYRQWKQIRRAGLKQLQESYVALYERTTLFRGYSSLVMPGFLQSLPYARALLSQIADFYETVVDDIDAAADARVRRSEIIRTRGRRFVILVEESVLHNIIGGSEVMSHQLDHLQRVMSLPAVSVGIIPSSTRRTMWGLEAFRVFDDTRVNVELLSAAISITEPTEVGQYIKAHQRLANHALYGDPARTVIESARAALADSTASS